MNHFKWDGKKLILLDQRKLPYREEYFHCKNHKEIAKAISEMIIRGAPAIGATAAYGVVLGIKDIFLETKDPEQILRKLSEVENTLKKSRPTAINLMWAVKRMIDKISNVEVNNIDEMLTIAEKEAKLIEQEDILTNKSIGEQGKTLIKDGFTILTHCNAGALATVDYGTALGVIRSAFKEKDNISVIACETRPYLQGARLTTWELLQDNIPTTLITDNMAGYCMSKNLVDIIIVGADRIAKNGDTANKIGTYSLALLAYHHNIPFYIAAPSSTFDLSINSGDEIPIENRDKKEVTMINETIIAPEEVNVLNPSFDVTPRKYISGIITEKGIIKTPQERSIMEFMERSS